MAKDILLGEDLDLVIVGNDLAWGESTQQEMVLMMTLEPGELKHDAGAGLGLRKRMKGQTSLSAIQSDIQEQAEYCQIALTEIQIAKTLQVFT